MNTKRLYLITLAALILDIASCHLVFFTEYLPQYADYYMYNLSQAVVMCVLYYRIAYSFESIKQEIVNDKYVKRINYLFFVMVPFASKQILDQLINNYTIDLLDYPILIILLIYGYHKYYLPIKLFTCIDKWKKKKQITGAKG